MSKTIWKFPIETQDRFKLDLPLGAKILTVQMQNNTVCIWALVDLDKKLETREFRIYGTGHEVYDDPLSYKQYIGTYQLSGGALVFHVFEYIFNSKL